jgi:hypothetical protein
MLIFLSPWPLRIFLVEHSETKPQSRPRSVAAYAGSLVVTRSPVAAPTLHLLKLMFRDAKRNSPTTFRNNPKILGIVSVS